MVEASSLIGRKRESKGSEGTIECHAPFDGSLLGTAPICGWDEADAAVQAALEAFPSWSATPLRERQGVLAKVVSAIESESEDLARLMAQEVGKPIAWSRAEVTRLRLTFQLAVSLLEEVGDERLNLDFDNRGKDYEGTVSRFAVGPLFAIVPYNWPYNLAAHKLAPALAAGCSVVLKPSPLAPLSTLALAGLVSEAGLPSGVLNALLCSNETAERIVKDPRIKMVSFTGSEAVGWHIKSLVPDKRVTLELGGDASCIVFDDADLERAASRIAMSGYGYAGQVCISAQHVLVQDGAYSAMRKHLVAATLATKTGDPMSEQTVCGPMISADAAERVMAWIEEAEDRGAHVLAGGNRIGNMVEPTLIEDVPGDCRLATEEAFGPVLTLARFDDEGEAYDAVNRSRFGIHCSVFTGDAARIERAFSALEVGGVIANEFPSLRFDNMPYGGEKRSGFGREGVRYAYEEMTTPKVLLELRR
ncbi:MAG TPA: aldehyde dehydrogenase family protein [Fimbriimonadaceae bacterium]|nr:aldehyde dehydrogenase family protein [Fimbriimonadaceae bacterium]